MKLVQTPYSDLRKTVVISTPLRNFAATMCATGAVCGKAANIVKNPHELAYSDFKELLPGANIECFYKGRWIPAVFDRIDENGSIRARFSTTDCFLYKPKEISQIRKSTKKNFKPPSKHALNAPVPIKGIFHYLVESLCKSAVPDAPEPGITCTITGRVNAIQQEVTSLCLGRTKSSQIVAEGSLQEVLQIDRLITSKTAVARTTVFSVRDSEVSNSAPLVVLDGPAAFLHNETRLASRDQIVILDRTDPAYGEATHVVRDRYIRRSHVQEVISLPEAPTGVGMSMFWRTSTS